MSRSRGDEESVVLGEDGALHLFSSAPREESVLFRATVKGTMSGETNTGEPWCGYLLGR